MSTEITAAFVMQYTAAIGAIRMDESGTVRIEPDDASDYPPVVEPTDLTFVEGLRITVLRCWYRLRWAHRMFPQGKWILYRDS